MALAAPSPAASAPPAPPPRWRRIAVRAAWTLGIVLIAAWGLFSWLFHDPFEGEVEALDRCIPSWVGFAVRGSAEDLLRSEFVRVRVLGREDVDRRLHEAGAGDGLRRLAEEQERLNARLPGFLGGVDLRTDLLGRESVVFGTLGAGPADPPLAKWAAATRLSRKARLLLSPLKHEWARRRVEEGSPLRITRFPLLYEVDLRGVSTDPGWDLLYAARVRDVLIVGNDRTLVQDAAHLAQAGGSALPDRPDAVDSFSEKETAPLRAFLDLGRLAEDRRQSKDPDGKPVLSLGEAIVTAGGPAAFVGLLLDPDALSSAAAVVRFPSADEASVEVAAVRNDAGLPTLPAALAESTVRPAAESLREAAVLAPAEGAILAGRLECRPGAVLQAMFGTLDAEVREALEKEVEKQSGTTLNTVAKEFDDYLEPGLSIVVERLPECDALPLDRMDPPEGETFVLPLPGVLLVLRQRASAGDAAAEGFLRRRLATDWKEAFDAVEDLEGLPEGMRGIRFRPRALTGERDLVRPAAAFEGDLVMIASNEGTLRRALECRAGSRPALSDDPEFAGAAEAAGEGQAGVVANVRGVRAFLRDQRREAATDAIAINLVKERGRIQSAVVHEIMQGRQELNAKDVEAEVDRRVEELQKERREVKFPRAVEAYLDRLKAFDEVRAIGAGLAWDSSGFRLRARLLLAGRP